MGVDEQVDKLLQKKNPVKKHFNHKLFIGFGAFVVTVLIITLTALPLFDDKSLLSHVQTYLESKEYNNPLVASQPLNGSAYNYWYAPENSFGINQIKTLNFTFWRSWLKKYFSYRLEARANNESTWQNANSLLNVSLLFNQTNNTCKVTLTLNTSAAPVALYYRFTLVANRSVISHINKSVDYEYTLNLSANQTENYSLVYNYSDLVPYIQSGKITIKQGIWNNYFYQRIKTNKKIAVNRTFVIDPTFGNSGLYLNKATMTGWTFAIYDTPASGGTVNNITAYVDTNNVNTNVTCALYEYIDYTTDYAGNIITNGVTETKTHAQLGGGVAGWYPFNYTGTKPTVTGSTNYYITITIENASDMGYSGTSGQDIRETGHGGTFEDPWLGESTDVVEWMIYASYTESGISWQTVNSSINGSAYNEIVFSSVNSTINGSAYNEIVFQAVNNSINGSAYNQIVFSSVNSTTNGSAYNETSIQVVNSSTNGSAYNTSALSWQGVNSTTNGSAYNLTEFSSVNSTINGSAYNQIVFSSVNSTTNGSAYNVSTYFKVVNSTINGSCYNTSIPSAFNVTLIYPSNNSNIYAPQPTLRFNISHPSSNVMNWSIYVGENYNYLLASDVNVSDGTYVYVNFHNVTEFYTDYNYSVNVSDGTDWINVSCTFQAILQGGGGITGYGAALAIATGAIMLSVVGLIGINEKKKRRGRI